MKHADLQNVVDADVLQLPINPHVEVKLRGAGCSVVAQDRLLVTESHIALDSARRKCIVLDPGVDGQLLQIVDSRSRRDRKSTRLNSSHLVISYAVFCLKKKKNIEVS